MPLISASYLERKLRAVLSLKGSDVLRELDDARHLITLENDRPEWAFVGNEFLGVRGFDTGAGVAAQIAFAIIENPDGSGVLTIVEGIRNQLNASITVNIEVGSGTPPALSAAPGAMTFVPFHPRDLRAFKPSASPSPLATHLRDDGHAVTPMAGVPANNQLLTEVIFGASGVQQTNDVWILPPSSRLWLMATVVNNQISAHVTIRERPIEGVQMR